MTLTFDDEHHIYRLDGEIIPSVSEIIAPIQEDSLAAVDPDVVRRAAERGTRVHELTQMYDYTGEVEYEDEYFPYMSAYTDFLNDHPDLDWDGIESMVCSTWTPVSFAGTVDRWMYRDGQLTILDIKTVQTATPMQKLALCIQTKAYETALGEWKRLPADTICKRYGLYLLKNGKYRLFDCQAFEQKDGIEANATLSWLMRLWAEKQEFKGWLQEIQNKHKRQKKDD